jgi:hypothetical protein
LCPFQERRKRDPHTSVIGVLFNTFGLHSLRVKAQSVVFDVNSRDLLEISAKRSGGIVAFRQEVRIARRTITFPRPKFGEQSAFQNKRVPVFGFAQPEEHSFEAILREHKSKVVIPLLRKIE